MTASRSARGGARPEPRRGGAPAFALEDYDRARHGDGPAQVVEAVFREYGFTWEPDGYNRDVLRPEEAYAPPKGFFAVAVCGGRVVGTVGGLLRGGGVAELERLYLVREERGKGLGRALAERFLVWARENGCRRAIAWSDKRLLDAHALYTRLGFRVVGDRICEPDPDKAPEWGFALDM